jgi:hypothetical protein
MAASANRIKADRTTTRPETPFLKKNQAELVLAQSGLFQQARWFFGMSKKAVGLMRQPKKSRSTLA